MARVRIGLVGLLIITFAGCGGPSSPTGSPAASVVAPVTMAPTVVAPTIAPLSSPSEAHGWQVVPTRLALGAAALFDVITFRGSLVAVGIVFTDTTHGSGVIWSSADGGAWRSMAGAELLRGLGLRAVAAGDPGIVVVGDSDSGAVVLFSPDGVSWSREALPGNGPGAGIRAVAYRQGRFVAVGDTADSVPGAVSSWISDDGRSWKAVSIVGGGRASSWPCVAAGPDGFVAYGGIGMDTYLWVSTSGATWSRSLRTFDCTRLRYAGGRFFLVNQSGVLSSSTDGRHWASTTLPGFESWVDDVAAIPGGFVSVGPWFDPSQPSSDPGPERVATAGRDPTSWTAQPQDPVFAPDYVNGLPVSTHLSAILVSPDGAYLVGVGDSPSGESVFLYPDPASLVTR
jgi:hypothetical protein